MTAAREGMGLGLGMGLEMGGGSKRSGMYVGGRQVGNGSGRQDSTLRFADDDNNSWGERERIPSNVSSPFFFLTVRLAFLPVSSNMYHVLPR
jgi:hypothetical protein